MKKNIKLYIFLIIIVILIICFVIYKHSDPVKKSLFDDDVIQIINKYHSIKVEVLESKIVSRETCAETVGGEMCKAFAGNKTFFFLKVL